MVEPLLRPRAHDDLHLLGEEFEARRGRWLAGSVDDVTERVDELRELGVSRIYLQHLNHSDDEMVALIGERLLPALDG